MLIISEGIYFYCYCYNYLLYCPLFWMLLVLEYLPVILETLFVFFPTLEILRLLGAFRLLTLCAKMSVSSGNPLLH